MREKKTKALPHKDDNQKTSKIAVCTMEKKIADALKPLAPRERSLLIGIAIKNLSHKDAGLQAGYKSDNVSSVVSQALHKTKLSQALSKLQEAQVYGLTREYLFTRHRELLDATKFISNGSNSIEVPDNSARARGLELGYKLLGLIKEEAAQTEESFEDMMRRLRPGSADEAG